MERENRWTDNYKHEHGQYNYYTHTPADWEQKEEK